jgi:DNA helicase II / ATP-dependent DNA helicase PcrA
LGLNVDELLTGLTEPQRAAVVHGDGPLLVIAGPGSGKTRVITHRAAYLARTITQARHILAITFTNKAAREMGERMERLEVGAGLTCSTFHSFCARSLRIYGERAGIKPDFSIFDESDQQAAMKTAIARVGLSPENFTPGRLVHRVSRLKNAMVLAHQFMEQAHGWEDQSVAKMYTAYQQVLREHNALDFDDLLVEMALLLGKDAELREHLEDRYRYVLVDEYQDTNHAQYLIARGLSLTRENLCVTGDPDQSIYAWRGANLQNILQFEEDFPKANVIRLEENFRSSPQVLEAADSVIKHNRKRKRKALFTSNPGGQGVRVAECEDQAGEASFVAEEIKKHAAGGGRYSDVAVFYRTNALSRNVEAALRDATIPYQVARGVAFYQRKEIKDVLAYMKVVANPLDGVALERIINTPPRGIGKATVERLLAHARTTGRSPLVLLEQPEQIPGASKAAIKGMQSFMSLLAGIAESADLGGVHKAVEYAVSHSGLMALHGEAEDSSAAENMNELISAAAEYDRQHTEGEGGLIDWLTQVSLVSDVDAIDPEVGAVTLMTLHAAKGLEFNQVFMIGLEDGLLPHQRSREEHGDAEEERRLCFVGMTRAKRGLTMTFAKWRETRGISQRTTSSQFLHELPDSVEWIEVDDGEENRYDSEDEDETIDFHEWRQGQMVRHPSFGAGQILSLERSSSGTRAQVRFRGAGVKTLILEYARLEPLEFDEGD